MKTAKLWIVAPALLLALAGCNHKSGRTSQEASALATNAAMQSDKAQAMKIITPCLPANQFTLAKKSARDAMLTCIVPNDPKVKAQLEQCVSSAATADHLATKAGRLQFLEGANPHQPSLVSCVVRYAGKKGGHS